MWSANSARLGPQNAKAILDIVVCDALDVARQHFVGKNPGCATIR